MLLHRSHVSVLVVALLIGALVVPTQRIQAAPNNCVRGCSVDLAAGLIVCAAGGLLLGPIAGEVFAFECVKAVGVDYTICMVGCGIDASRVSIPMPTPESPFIYDRPGNMTVRFGRVDTSGTFLGIPGDIPDPKVFLLDMDGLAGQLTDSTSIVDLPWIPVGSSNFDGDSAWVKTINMSSFPSAAGYLVRFDMLDSNVGSEPLIGMGVVVPRSAVTSVTSEDVPKGIRLSATPNPAPSQSTLTFSLPSEGPVQLEIYDLLGRRLRNWAWSALPAGDHHITWDGRDENGKLVSAAIVFGRLKINTTTYTTRIVRTK